MSPAAELSSRRRPLAGFNTGFMICGVIMLVGGIIGTALMHPEGETDAVGERNAGGGGRTCLEAGALPAYSARRD